MLQLLNSLSPEEFKEVQGESDIYLSDDRSLGYLNIEGAVFFYIQVVKAMVVIRDNLVDKGTLIYADMFENKN